MASGNILQVDTQYLFDEPEENEPSEIESSDHEESEQQREAQREDNQQMTDQDRGQDQQQQQLQKQEQLQAQGPWFQDQQNDQQQLYNQQQQQQQQYLQYQQFQQSQQQFPYNLPFPQPQNPLYDYNKMFYQGQNNSGQIRNIHIENQIQGAVGYRQTKVKNIAQNPRLNKRAGGRPGSANLSKQGAPYLMKYAGINVGNALNTGTQSNYLRFQNTTALNTVSTKYPSQSYNQESYQNETLNSKIDRNFFQNQNNLLKAQIKAFEKELLRKDHVIKQLVDQANKEATNITQNESYHSSHHLQNSSNTLPQSQNQNSISHKYKLKIKQLKNELILKQEELQNMQRTLKYTKIQEFQVEITQVQEEVQKLKNLLQQEVQKPRIDPAVYFKLQEESQQQQMLVRGIQQEAAQLAQLVTGKDTLIMKRDRKIGKLIDKLKVTRDRNKALLKKQKVLFAKIQELEKFGAGLVSKSSNRGRNPAQQSIEPNISSSSSPARCPYHHKKKGVNEADLYEQFCVEKIKNERLVARLKKLGHQIDAEQIYSEEKGQAETDLEIALKFHFNGATKIITIPSSFEELIEILQQEFELESQPMLRAKSQPQAYVSDLGLLQNPQEEVFLEIKDDEEGDDDEQDANQYEQEQFDEYQEEDTQQYVDMVTENEVKQAFLEIKLKLQIKRVKREHAFKFLLSGLPKSADGTKDKLVRLNQVQQQLQQKFKMKPKDGLLAARYLVEVEGAGPKRPNQVVFDDQRVIKRRILKVRFRQLIGDYGLFNGLALTSYLNRLTRLLEDTKPQIEEMLQEADEDEIGEVSFKEFEAALEASDAPNLEKDLKEFMYFILLRQSDTLHFVNYQAFLDIFDEDYLVEKSRHEEKKDFEPQSDSSRQESESEVGNGPQGLSPDIVVDEEDLMLTVDDILAKIVAKFPNDTLKQLSHLIKPMLSSQSLEQKRIHYLIQSDLIQFLSISLQLPSLTEKEVQCVLHILVREDLEGVILYDEFKSLIKNYIQKEKKFLKSVSQGIRYDLLGGSPELLAFIQQIKQIVNPTDDEGNTDPSKRQDLRDVLRKVIKKQYIVGKDKKQTQVEIADFESLLDSLFMSHQIRCPPMKVQESLKLMLCIDEKYPDLVLIRKLERIIADMDFVYVNLIKIQQRPDYLAQFKPKVVVAPRNPQLTAQQPANSPPAIQSNSQPQKKGVQFNQEKSQTEEKKDLQRIDSNNSEFQYDNYRKKFTVKAEEIPSDDDIPHDSSVHSSVDISKTEKMSDSKKQQIKAQKGQQQQSKPQNKSPAVVKPAPKQQEEVKEHRMDFQYDQFRKKYTVKAEEVEEEDFIEDNYE